MEDTTYKFVTKNKNDMLFCLHGIDCYFALWNLSQWIRSTIKYAPEGTHKEYKRGLEDAKFQLLMAMEDQGINFDLFERGM